MDDPFDIDHLWYFGCRKCAGGDIDFETASNLSEGDDCPNCDDGTIYGVYERDYLPIPDSESYDERSLLYYLIEKHRPGHVRRKIENGTIEVLNESEPDRLAWKYITKNKRHETSWEADAYLRGYNAGYGTGRKRADIEKEFLKVDVSQGHCSGCDDKFRDGSIAYVLAEYERPFIGLYEWSILDMYCEPCWEDQTHSVKEHMGVGKAVLTMEDNSIEIDSVEKVHGAQWPKTG